MNKSTIREVIVSLCIAAIVIIVFIGIMTKPWVKVTVGSEWCDKRNMDNPFTTPTKYTILTVSNGYAKCAVEYSPDHVVEYSYKLQTFRNMTSYPQ